MLDEENCLKNLQSTASAKLAIVVTYGLSKPEELNSLHSLTAGEHVGKFGTTISSTKTLTWLPRRWGEQKTWWHNLGEGHFWECHYKIQLVPSLLVELEAVYRLGVLITAKMWLKNWKPQVVLWKLNWGPRWWNKQNKWWDDHIDIHWLKNPKKTLVSGWSRRGRLRVCFYHCSNLQLKIGR